MTTKAGYEPSEREKREIDDWFAHYDALVAKGDVEAMADQALFPLNEVTDDQHGFAQISATGRERFLAQMREAGIDGSEIEMRSSRALHFLSSALVFVVTDAVFGSGDEETIMRYGDLLVRTPAGWRFQTMVAGGMSAQI